MYAEKNAPATAESMAPREALDPKKFESRKFDPKKLEALYPSDSYQKILDYHVVEILLSTIVLAVIILLRFYR